MLTSSPDCHAQDRGLRFLFSSPRSSTIPCSRGSWDAHCTQPLQVPWGSASPGTRLASKMPLHCPHHPLQLLLCLMPTLPRKTLPPRHCLNSQAPNPCPICLLLSPFDIPSLLSSKEKASEMWLCSPSMSLKALKVQAQSLSSRKKQPC